MMNNGSFDIVDFVCDNRRSQRLFQRCEAPALPCKEMFYSRAKRLEYDGDLAGALNMFYRAFANGERVDSCVKDIAGLLNMMGRTAEAVDFLLSHSEQVTGRAGYDNLLNRLQTELLKENSSDLPKGITVTILDKSLGPVSVALCDRLFPNPAKIKRILITDREGFVGAVHFATHSSARKALQVPKLFSCQQVACSWNSLYTESRLQMISEMETQCHEFENTCYEELPSHLRTFGGSNCIPIYRDDDDSIPPLPAEKLILLEEAARQRASEIDAKRNRMSLPLSPGELSRSTASPGSTKDSISPSADSVSSVGRLKPFISEVVHPDGRIGAALVVPLDSDFDYQGSLQKFEHIDAFRTPHKLRGSSAVSQIKTPSPIVERCLFT